MFIDLPDEVSSQICVQICVLDSVQVVDSETAKLLEQATSVSERMLLFDGLPA